MSTLAPSRPAAAPARRGSLGHEQHDVALLVARRGDGALTHSHFGDLPGFLAAGDLFVVNSSATLPAALSGVLDGGAVVLHLSTPASGGDWVVELRTRELEPYFEPPLGAIVELEGDASARLLARFAGSDRLTLARLSLGRPLEDYLRRHGRPIRYTHEPRARPIEAYQTVFARHAGSAEMPSAGRPFTTALVAELVSRGILIAPLILHAGVSSPERGESPYPERYGVSPATARLVNAVRGWGGRVIAVGTTVVRALETVAAPDGTVVAGKGSTGLIVSPERGLRAIDGLLTGWHEPDSSHLQMLEAAAGPDLIVRSYNAARAHGYRWHEFGDSHLILP